MLLVHILTSYIDSQVANVSRTVALRDMHMQPAKVQKPAGLKLSACMKWEAPEPVCAFLWRHVTAARQVHVSELTGGSISLIASTFRAFRFA